MSDTPIEAAKTASDETVLADNASHIEGVVSNDGPNHGPENVTQDQHRSTQSAQIHQSYCDPRRAPAQFDRWRTLLGKTPEGDPGSILDQPDNRLVMLKLFGDTKRLADLCMVYPRTAATTLIEGASCVLAQTARQLTSLDWGLGGPDAVHAALSSLKDRADLAISIAVLSGEWSVHKAAAARTDLAERICETVLSWLMRSAVKRGELRLPETQTPSPSGLLTGIFLLAGGDFAHEDISTTGPLDLVTVYDPETFTSNIPSSNDRALIRVGAEFKEAIEGRPGGQPLYNLRTPFGSKLNGSGLMEPVTSIQKIIKAPQSEIFRSWLATARVVAGDRTLGGQFMEEIEADVWNDKPLLTQDMAEQFKQPSHDLLSVFRSISQLCRLTMGRSRPLFRTASTHDILETAAASKVIAEPMANRLTSGHELARMLETAGHALRGAEYSFQIFKGVDKTEDLEGIRDHLASLSGYGSEDLLSQTVQGIKADAHNALDQLLYGPRDAFQRYIGDNTGTDLGTADFGGGDQEKLEDLGYLDGALVSSIIETWLATDTRKRANKLVGASSSPRFAARAPGLLTAFGETQYPTHAVKLFDKLVTNCPPEIDLYSVLEEGSVARARIVDTFGNFPEMVSPLLETTDRSRIFVDDLIADNRKDKLVIDDWISTHPAPVTEDIDAISAWRNEAIAQVAFACASGLNCIADAVPLLSAIHHELLTGLFSHLKYGPYAGDKKVTDNLVLFSYLGEWRCVPGDRASIGFILTRKKKDTDLEARATQFVEDYLAALEKIGTGPFSVSIDLSRRPGGGSGPLVSNLLAWEQYVRTEAVAMDQISLARTQILVGTKTAGAAARAVLREVVANERRTTLTLRDLDRARTQHRTRSVNGMGKVPSVWDINSTGGGRRDIELIIKVLMYRHGATHPWLQESDTESTLTAMAESGLIETETATTLINARLFWASLSLVCAWSGWSSPEITPVRKRFAKMVANAVGVTSFSHIPPLIRGYTDDGNRLYDALVMGRGDQANRFASAG